MIKFGAYAIDDYFYDFNQEFKLSNDIQQVGSSVKKAESDIQIDLFSIDSDNVDESLSKEPSESQISRSYANKDELDFSSDSNFVASSVDKLNIEQQENNASLVVVQDSEVAKCIRLEKYGSLLNLFYQDIVQHCRDSNQISLEDLIKIYPELTKPGITKWLGLLVEEGLIVREGKKHLYQLP